MDGFAKQNHKHHSQGGDHYEHQLKVGRQSILPQCLPSHHIQELCATYQELFAVFALPAVMSYWLSGSACMVRICGVAFDSNLGLTANLSAALKSQCFAPFLSLFKIMFSILTV